MLSEKQKQIVETKESKVLVNCSAASGKTNTLIERIKFLLDMGVNPEKIVAITFTNAAAGELRERIGLKSGKCFIGTVHSYCNYLLLRKGIDTSDLIEVENFDSLFNRFEKHPECIPNVDYLFLDEAQDSTSQQFKFLLEIIKPKNWMLFSDHRQSIYSFLNADPEYIFKLKDRDDVVSYQLNENYRNSANILDFAKRIAFSLGYRYRDNSIPMKKEKGQVMTTFYSLDKIYDLVSENDNYGDWFILTRTNDQLNMIYNYLSRRKIPCLSFKRSELTNKDLNLKMSENKVKILTIHTSKGLQNKNVIVVGATTNMARSAEELRISYVAATRAEDILVWMSGKKKKVEPEYEIINWES